MEEDTFPWTINDCKGHIDRVHQLMQDVEEVFVQREQDKWYQDALWRRYQDELTFWKIKKAKLEARANKRKLNMPTET